MKTMKISKYFEVVKPVYVYLKLIPDSSVRNYNSKNIAKMIANMYESISRRIYKIEKKYFFKSALRCSYFIDIQKTNVNFYFIVPSQYENIAKEKITEVWPHVTIEKTDSINEFKGDIVSYQLSYKKEDALSLNTDSRSNALLNNVLNTIDVMESGDRVGIFYNFIPINQRYWAADYKRTIEKWKEYKPLERNKFSVIYLLKYSAICLLFLTQSVVDAMNDFFGDKKEKNNLSILTDALSKNRIELSDQTKKKKNCIVLDTQIVVVGSGENINRSKNNVIAVCQGFSSIEGDNDLSYSELKRFEGINNDCVYIKADKNRMSIDECQNLIQLPGRELLSKHKIEHVNTLELKVPSELRKGIMCIGESTYKGEIIKSYMTTDKHYQFLTTCIVGPTRSGKTTLISNLCVDAAKAGEINVIFDWCSKCELSSNVLEVIKKQGLKYMLIDCSDTSNLQGMGYNELYCEHENAFERYRSAKAQSVHLMNLINSVHADESELKARMERYLESASLVAFVSNGPIRDVLLILQNHDVRKKYIEMVPSEQNDYVKEYVESLKELDEHDKKTNAVIGTKISAVQGILNRVSKLKQNTYIECMLKKDCTGNFNLTKEIMRSQTIIIKMPENMFSTETEKDIYATYWITKLWAALQQRKFISDKAIKVNMYFDELYQVPNCQYFLKSKLSQIAKFGAKPIISCHYLGQILPIRNELKAANTSYMLLNGCDKINYNELKEELDPFSLEDLLKLKRYHSLNLMKTSNGYAKFITKLPKPII